MRKYLAITASLASAAVVWYALPPGGYAYERSDGTYPLPSGCAPHVVTAVQSVFPEADISSVQEWGCAQVSVCAQEDPESGECQVWEHDKARCEGSYHKVLTGAQWWARATRDGFRAWSPVSIDRDAGTVTVLQRTGSRVLDAAQTQAHAALLANSCLLDADAEVVPWNEMSRFVISRSDGGMVVRVWYAVSAPDPLDVAAAVQAGKALRPLVEAP